MKKLLWILIGTSMIFVSCNKNKIENTAEIVPVQQEIKSEPQIQQTSNEENSLVTVHFNKEIALVDEGNPKPYKAETAFDVIGNMKNGWNLGNTLDATGGAGFGTETSWGMPLTTKEMIDGLAKSGIKSIRIPITWTKHLNDKNYTIDPQWMNRVKTIVDWAIQDGMYVIINCHHDNFGRNMPLKYGQGYYPTKANNQESLDFLVNIWEQISLAFNNSYDEHLMFEVMNEPRLCGTGNEWWFDKNNALCKEAAEVLNSWNQILVDTIRASGGNNAKRVIGVPALQGSADTALTSEYVVPEDPANMIAQSVHMYSPYSFAMESPGETVFTDAHKKSLVSTFDGLSYKFEKKGIPFYVGEYGATNKNNLEEKVAWFTFFNKNAQKHKAPCFLWDNGQFKVTGTDGNRFSEKYGFYNRSTQTWFEPEILEAIVESTK